MFHLGELFDVIDYTRYSHMLPTNFVKFLSQIQRSQTDLKRMTYYAASRKSVFLTFLLFLFIVVSIFENIQFYLQTVSIHSLSLSLYLCPNVCYHMESAHRNPPSLCAAIEQSISLKQSVFAFDCPIHAAIKINDKVKTRSVEQAAAIHTSEGFPRRREKKSESHP